MVQSCEMNKLIREILFLFSTFLWSQTVAQFTTYHLYVDKGVQLLNFEQVCKENDEDDSSILEAHELAKDTAQWENLYTILLPLGLRGNVLSFPQRSPKQLGSNLNCLVHGPKYLFPSPLPDTPHIYKTPVILLTGSGGLDQRTVLCYMQFNHNAIIFIMLYSLHKYIIYNLYNQYNYIIQLYTVELYVI